MGSLGVTGNITLKPAVGPSPSLFSFSPHLVCGGFAHLVCGGFAYLALPSVSELLDAGTAQ